MAIIYEPSGKAREYCQLAANLYRGCGHGCLYCYAPDATRVKRENFYSAPAPRNNVIPQLTKDAASGKYKGPVLLCFTCDPYQPINDEYDLAGLAIKTLKKHDIPVEILTKGGARAFKDLPLLDKRDKLGATLTFCNWRDSLKWEPFAALPDERFELLEKAKALGIPTWASLEPVIDPVQTLEIIRLTHKYVDYYKVGKLNYLPEAKMVDWAKFAKAAVALLESLNCRYYIKNDLRKFIET